jgi:hypothetical protein
LNFGKAGQVGCMIVFVTHAMVLYGV